MKKIFVLIAAFLISLPACDNDFYTSLPYAPVYLNIDLDFRDNDLIPMLATKSFTQKRDEIDKLGYGGILLINGLSGNGQINLYAYDLSCPNEKDRQITIIPDTEGNAVCPQCQEVFYIASGTGIPTKGISKYPLQVYYVRNTSGNRFLVSN